MISYPLEILEFLEEGKIPSEKGWEWLHNLCYMEALKERERGKQPHSKKKKKIARSHLVLAVLDILGEHGGSIENAIKKLPESVLKMLSAAGYKINNDFSLKRLFIRADDELCNGKVQSANVQIIKPHAKEIKQLQKNIERLEKQNEKMDKLIQQHKRLNCMKLP